MIRIHVLLLAICHFTSGEGTQNINISSPKDMYVVRATVYQVGILTNKSKDADLNKTGQQEAITFYHSKGREFNINDLPVPLATNVTAENLVGIAPANKTWSLSMNSLGKVSKTLQRLSRNVVIPANITKASLLIPAAAGVQSISLPLLSINNNISKIPVPIPNISIVSYTKASTLVKKP